MCYEKVAIAYIYPFPFSVFALCLTIAILVTICFSRSTKFLESTCAMVCFPELIAWIAIVYMYAANHKPLSFLLSLAGLALHIIINISYGIIYQKIISKRGDEHFLTFYSYNKTCSNVTLIFATIFSFKFHLISFSSCANGDHLKARWNKR